MDTHKATVGVFLVVIGLTLFIRPQTTIITHPEKDADKAKIYARNLSNFQKTLIRLASGAMFFIGIYSVFTSY